MQTLYRAHSFRRVNILCNALFLLLLLLLLRWNALKGLRKAPRRCFCLRVCFFLVFFGRNRFTLGPGLCGLPMQWSLWRLCLNLLFLVCINTDRKSAFNAFEEVSVEPCEFVVLHAVITSRRIYLPTSAVCVLAHRNTLAQKKSHIHTDFVSPTRFWSRTPKQPFREVLLSAPSRVTRPRYSPPSTLFFFCNREPPPPVPLQPKTRFFLYTSFADDRKIRGPNPVTFRLLFVAFSS